MYIYILKYKCVYIKISRLAIAALASPYVSEFWHIFVFAGPV